jgi:CheY-like chemotaxis protein
VQRAERSAKTGHGLVLVMDDDHIVRRMVGSMLTALGYEAITTSNGAEALERTAALLAEGKQVSAALLDLTVRSGEGGRETVRPLRALLPQVPIIASSGYSEDPVMAEPQQFGFTASLPKPFRLNELGDLLSQLVAR